MGQMAQKISKVDHDELLKALNEALSEESVSYTHLTLPTIWHV